MQIEECILMIRRSACCDKRPVSGEDFALRFDHLGELCRQPVVHSAREIAVAAETIGKDVNPQTRKLRDKHEIVVCHVMNSFILMTRPATAFFCWSRILRPDIMRKHPSAWGR